MSPKFLLGLYILADLLLVGRVHAAVEGGLQGL